MAKKDKFYFGIMEDGISLKVAQLRVRKNTIQVLSLEQTQMEKSIYADEGKKKKKKSDEDFSARIASGEKISFDDLKGLDVTEQSQGSIDSIVSPHENLLSKYPLDNGYIALNANDKKLSKMIVNESIKNLTPNKLSKLKVISKDEKKDKSITYGHIPLPHSAYEIILHRGDNKLFHYLEKFNQSQYKSKFHYALIDTNDISLINAVRLNYEFSADENTLLLYLGKEYHQVLLFAGNDYIKSIPIVIPPEFSNVKEIVRSKLMLLHDEGELPAPSRLILAGEHSKKVDVSFFQTQYTDIIVEQFQCSNLQIEESADIDADLIAEYIIPISMAWKSSNAGKDKVIQTNFLQKKIIERQKVFRLGWHGFIIIILIFAFSLLSTNKILSVQEKNQNNMKRMAELRSRLNENEIYTQENQSIYDEIRALKDSDNRIRAILHDQQKHSYIFHKLSTVFEKHPVSWLKEFSIKDSIIQIYGTTTELEHTIVFSNIFPNGQLNHIKNEQVTDLTVWSFEIHFPYQLIKPLEQKAETTDLSEKERYNEIVYLYNLNQWQEAEQKITAFESDFPQSSFLVNLQYLHGEMMFQQHRYVQAESFLTNSLVQNSPLLPYSYYMLARTKQKLQKAAEANVYFTRLEKEFPNHTLSKRTLKLREKQEVNHE